MKKLMILPYMHLIGLASLLFCLIQWVIFGYIYWKKINQANLVVLYVFGAIFLTLGAIAIILAAKILKLYPFSAVK